MAKKKETGTSLVKWEEEFKNLAKEETKDITLSSGKFISCRGGQLSFNGKSIPDNELSCVILGWTRVNAYYDPKKPYNPENPASPICYSFGRNEKEMEPHEEAPDHQDTACTGCPMNEFGSGSNGKSKACKNAVRLALIAANDLEDLSAAEVVYFNVPPTSLKNILGYLKTDIGDKLGRPPWAVITSLKARPDAKTQVAIDFECEEPIDDTDLFPDLKELSVSCLAELTAPFVQREEKETPAKSGKGGKSKFARR